MICSPLRPGYIPHKELQNQAKGSNYRNVEVSGSTTTPVVAFETLYLYSIMLFILRPSDLQDPLEGAGRCGRGPSRTGRGSLSLTRLFFGRASRLLQPTPKTDTPQACST